MTMKQQRNTDKEKDKRMQKHKENSFIPFLWMIMIFVITLSTICVLEWFLQKETAQIIRDCVFAGVGTLTIGLLLLQDKSISYGRFFIVYIISCVLTFVSSFLPITGWPFIAVFLMLSLFGNSVLGIVSASCLLMSGLLISGTGFQGFFIYFLSGVTIVCMFQHLDENFRTGIPLFLSLLMLFVCDTAGGVLFVNEKLSPQLFMIPCINVVMSAIICFVVLKFYSYFVIFKYRDKYMEINDPEYVLLVRLKEKSKDAYYKAVHTAYFCDRISKKLGLDDNLTKACGYYHKIGHIQGKDSWENVYQIGMTYNFPPQVLEILEEYMNKNKPITQKETAVLMFSDTVVSSILYLFSKNAKVELEYGPVIDTVFRKKIESGILKDCNISMQEIEIMKNIFKQEKLYYDFLR